MKKHFLHYLILFFWAILPLATAITTTVTTPIITAAKAVVIDKNVDEFAGKRCNTPKKGSGVIVGIFSGVRDSRFLFNDGLETVDRYRCFTTMRECRGWVYTMQSRYNAQPARIARCKQF